LQESITIRFQIQEALPAGVWQENCSWTAAAPMHVQGTLMMNSFLVGYGMQ